MNIVQTQLPSDEQPEQRYKSLYLDTLGHAANNKGSSSTKPPAQPPEGYVHGSLSTAGISGAQPAIRSLKKQAIVRLTAAATAATGDNVSTTSQQPVAVQPLPAGDADDPGMQPKILHPVTVNKQDLQHTTADIEGAQPCPRNIFQHPRNTNPLNPEYKLPSSSLPLPSGPEQLCDKLLGDPLDVTDIPGATRRPRHCASRLQGSLDVTDIEGTCTAWRPQHRRCTGRPARDGALNVTDINSYMARFKPCHNNNSSSKGHPDGPHVPPRIKPRQNPAAMDNSLRTKDIEGTRTVLAHTRLGIADPHMRTTSTADIEGAAPADRDKLHLFERKKAAAASAAAQQECAQAVLSGLMLQPQELNALWKKCGQLDRDNSGFLTAMEMESAMQSASMQLSAADTGKLLSALKDNAGLLNYKQLTKQLKGRVSRPCSASQQQQQQQDLQGHSVQAAPGPSSAAPSPAGSTRELHDDHDGAISDRQPCLQVAPAGTPASVSSSKGADEEEQQQQVPQQQQPQQQQQQQQQQQRFMQRPSSAPTSSMTHAAKQCGRSDFQTISHWFGGSNRDVSTAAQLQSWRPGQQLVAGATSAFKAMQAGGSTRAVISSVTASPHQHSNNACSASGRHCRQASGRSPAAGVLHQDPEVDLLHGWMVGADPVCGTYQVLQPFGSSSGLKLSTSSNCNGEGTCSCQGSERAAGAAVQPPRVVAARVRPASAGACCCAVRSADACGQAAAAAAAATTTATGQMRRPASAGCLKQDHSSCGDDNEETSAEEMKHTQQWQRQGQHSNGQHCTTVPQQPLSSSAFKALYAGGSNSSSRCSSCVPVGRPASAPGSSRTAGSDKKQGSLQLCRTVGLAERRRQLETDLQTLLEVRMLE